MDTEGGKMVLKPFFLLRIFPILVNLFFKRNYYTLFPLDLFFPDPFSKNTLTSIVSTLAQRCHCEKVDAKMATASTNCCCSGSSNSSDAIDQSTINPWKDVPRFSPKLKVHRTTAKPAPHSSKKNYLYIYIYTYIYMYV